MVSITPCCGELFCLDGHGGPRPSHASIYRYIGRSGGREDAVETDRIVGGAALAPLKPALDYNLVIMGSFSELYFSDTRTLPQQGDLSEASPYLLSKYHVPLLWLALFEPKDITVIPEEDGVESRVYLVKDRTEAIRALETREAALLARFPKLKPLWLAQFKTLLEQTPLQYVHADTNEIGGMVGTGTEWQSTLQKMLGIFSTPSGPAPSFFDKLLGRLRASGSWAVFNKLLGTAFHGSAGDEPWPYCGGSATDVPMAWEPES